MIQESSTWSVQVLLKEKTWLNFRWSFDWFWMSGPDPENQKYNRPNKEKQKSKTWWGITRTNKKKQSPQYCENKEHFIFLFRSEILIHRIFRVIGITDLPRVPVRAATVVRTLHSLSISVRYTAPLKVPTSCIFCLTVYSTPGIAILSVLISILILFDQQKTVWIAERPLCNWNNVNDPANIQRPCAEHVEKSGSYFSYIKSMYAQPSKKNAENQRSWSAFWRIHRNLLHILYLSDRRITLTVFLLLSIWTWSGPLYGRAAPQYSQTFPVQGAPQLGQIILFHLFLKTRAKIQ